MFDEKMASRGNEERGDSATSGGYQDKTLICKECSSDFIFTAGEQEFYDRQGFENEPQRCKPCRDTRKNFGRGQRQMYEVDCANSGCTRKAKVPFQPSKDRPVYCSECFSEMNPR